MTEVTQSEGGPFVGESPEEDAREEPSLEKAFDRVAERASRAGYAGATFQIAIELVPEAHNQWVKTYRVIASDPT
ncbi:MAG: hypothetical protein M3Q59_00880 [Actinomycetota bacterium]|nr:hypothetical protein [Actinomycetota bacterium]